MKRYYFTRVEKNLADHPQFCRAVARKATNWLPLGFTKGFKRHRRDFYQDLGKPKQLWVRPLKKGAFALLERAQFQLLLSESS